MKRLIALAVSTLLIACTQTEPPEQTEKIGLKTYRFVDENRENWAGNGPRPVTTYVWYPAARGSEMTEIRMSAFDMEFTGGYAAEDAELRAGLGKRPLVVMSHGTGGSGMQMMWMGRRLAEAGYIAAAVDHHGNNYMEGPYDPRGFRLVWYRPPDLTVAIDQLLTDPTLGSVIDENKIAAVGFSLGGYTALSVAGGQISLDTYGAFCATNEQDGNCRPVSEFPDAEAELMKLFPIDPRLGPAMGRHGESFKDPRITFVAALSPALGPAFTTDSLVEIDIPIHIIYGGSDRVTPAETGALVLSAAIPDAQATLIHEDAGHYVFLNPCTRRGEAPALYCDDAASVNRDAVQSRAAEWVLNDLATHFSAFGNQ